MAKIKITETTAIAAADLADGDLIPVVDVSDTSTSSTGKNKKTTVGDLKTIADGRVAVHTGDTDDAHDASAISVLDTANNFTGTNVETVLAELPSRIGLLV